MGYSFGRLELELIYHNQAICTRGSMNLKTGQWLCGLLLFGLWSIAESTPSQCVINYEFESTLSSIPQKDFVVWV